MTKQKTYYQKYKERRTYKMAYHKACKEGWIIWFQRNGFPIPSSLSVNYHHKDPSTKLFEIGTFIYTHCITPDNETLLRAELKKCEPLTHSQHRSLHNPPNPKGSRVRGTRKII